MKTNLLKLVIAAMAFVGLIACGSKGSMPLEEAATWIAAYSPDRVDMGATIRIETTDSLRENINALCSLDKLFKFSPAIEGEVSFAEGGKYIDFKPEHAMTQGQVYECRLNLAELTDISSLKDFVFEFLVERRESKLDGISVVVDPNDVEKVIVAGNIVFSLPPSNDAVNASHLTCDDKDAKVTISATDKANSYSFKISGVQRSSKDEKLRIKYGPLAEFSEASAEVEVPGISEFKLISAERKESAEPFINLEFSAHLAKDQELDGIITIDDIDNIRFESNGTNVKVFYPQNSLVTMTMRISELLRDSNGRHLPQEVEQTFRQEVIPPAVEVPISGNILPDGTNLKFPFRAVNLAAVDVQVIKIYADNVMTFLQENEIEDTYRLRRVGCLIYKQTVRLDKYKSLNLHQWQNFSIDLKNLFRQEPGAIYNIRLSFCKEYSLYGRDSVEDITVVSDTPNTYVAGADDYDLQYYDWNEETDPTQDSYYMASSRMPVYNLVASNIGLVVKKAETNHMWTAVNDIMTTRPLAGVRVTAYNYQMRVIGSGISNAQGFADFKVADTPFVVVASNGVSKTYLKVNSGHELSLSSFDVNGKSSPQGIRGFIYGERGVWRPGDDIYLTLIVEDKQRTLPKNHPVTMELYTPMDQLYETKTLTKNFNGIYTFHTKTQGDAPTGSWSAKFKVGGQTFHHTVNIETIKPNRLKIKIEAPKVLYADDEAKVSVESHWLTGPAASGLKTNMQMWLYNDPRPFDSYTKYVFSNPLYEFQYSEDLLYSDTLDSLGRYTHDKKLPSVNNAPGMLQANLVARVFESGGDESLTSELVRYSPYKSYVGIHFKDKTFETDTNIEFPIVTLDADGKRVNREVSYKIYKLNWSWWWEGSAAELFQYVQSESVEIVKEGKLTTVDGMAKVPMRIEYPAWGRYLVYVEDTESGHATGGVVCVDWPEWRGRSAKDEDATAATMYSFSLDKKSYEVGEYVTVYLPKTTGGRVLLSIETGSRVVARHWVEVSANKEKAYRIRVTRDMTPNFYVNAMLLQPHSQTLNDLPIRLYGVQGASVVDKQTILHPVIELPSEIRPQQQFTVKVREKSGKPMSYTLAIVDEGLLDISAYKTPDPWAAMNEHEALGVKTWDMYNEVIGAYSGKFRTILSVGGDECFEESEAVGKQKRFNPIVKFLGPFTLNKGVNTHKVTLPMYVGSVRVMVVAANNGSYGHADKVMKVRSPLMLLTTLPRKLNCGDKIKMPVNIFTTEAGVKNVQVSVAIEGPLSCVGGNTKSVSFSRPDEKLVEFDLKCDVQKVGKAKVVVTAVGGGRKATETIWIDVDNPLPNVLTSESKVLAGDSDYAFNWNSFKHGSAVLTLSSIPTIDFSGAFSFVENYSHFCSEQLSSRAMYMLYARKFLNLEDQKRADIALESILKQLASRQLSSGGFVYWSGESEAHDWVSSMVGEVMTEARRQGFAISNQCYDKWKEYQLSVSRLYRHSTDQVLDLRQAYRLYTLVLAGEQPTAQMNKLRESKSISRQALLRLAACYSLVGRADVATKLIERADAMNSESGSYATFWSQLRDDAMELETYAIVGDKQKAFKMAEKVASKFSAQSCSTQEVAFVSAAINRYVGYVGNGVNEIIVAEGSAAEKSIRNLRGVKNIQLNTQSAKVSICNKGGESIYATFMTSRRPSADEIIKAENNGVSLSVSYTDLNDKPISVESIAQGTEFMAVIDTKKSSEYSQSMALTFIVPAGWEISNDRLVGGGYDDASVSYTDVRDDRISWYYSASQNKTKNFKVRLRAAYAGEYMLPSAICEDMYDTECRAVTSNGKTKVE